MRGAPVVVEGEDAERGDESVLEPLHAVPADVRHLVRDQAEQERHCEMNNTSLFIAQSSISVSRMQHLASLHPRTMAEDTSC